jgi:trehalose-phosphatase
MMISPPAALLDAQLAAAAEATALLVACDYDGTLAPIVDDPALAHPLAGSIEYLRLLAELTSTHVAVISGRSLSDLALFTRLPREVRLVGSHGAEFLPGFESRLPPAKIALTDFITRSLEAIASQFPGARVERKPAGAALHFRSVPLAVRQACIQLVIEGPGAIDGVSVKHGKMVVELAAVAADKGTALEGIRKLVHASAVVFVGDDLTDEDAFERLVQPPDLGIKVGPGDSAARSRVEDPQDVTLLLGTLYEARREWLRSKRCMRD